MEQTDRALQPSGVAPHAEHRQPATEYVNKSYLPVLRDEDKRSCLEGGGQ